MTVARGAHAQPMTVRTAALRVAFEAVARRQAAMPFFRKDLAVEVLAFRSWQDAWVGALITPWCLNVVAMPKERGSWDRFCVGDARSWGFPGGTCELLVADVGDLGRYQSAALFSPLSDFAHQHEIRKAARAALDMLFAEAATAHPLPPVPAADGGRPTLTRRAFVRGAWRE
ncbi:[NiFe]-hydrogenase assembly chaperone HybE [Acidiferrobacter thiooxydans]|uniref:[NiFe]-hydrogenase assembly chaperone HybE n=1 Tax=Acidiferrobacter thiooxydans TaxID=163359 RepID=UPI000A0464BB|nr:[NiFe]-hydrogenase assembly chaperone HybE [Acidiferrobacter thiooxydans]UEO00701.1 [NiFe]-hydrogenase assembly chaperone HybE [Acidiferrobacter thiooxydans]